MHELLLFGQIPASRHNQVLNIFAGIAAMQPQSVLEKHLVFKPNREPASVRPVQVGAVQDVQKSQVQALQAQTQGDLFYLKLVRNVTTAALEEETANDAMNYGRKGDGAERHGNGEDSVTTIYESAQPTQSWTLQFRDIPEVARQRPVTSRLIVDTLITSGDPLAFMKALDYSHHTTYFISGHRFTHLSTDIRLYRFLLPPETFSQDSIDKEDDISQARLLDTSGTYLLQAAVKIYDGSKVETMTRGVNELMSLKELLKGAVELEMGDRLALDTRVR